MSDDLTAELAKLRKTHLEATPGPWGAEEEHGTDIAGEGRSEVRVVGPLDSPAPVAATFISRTLETDNTEADTAFIVAARTAMPRLVAFVEAVLALADDWDAEAAQASDRSDVANERGETGTFYLAAGKTLALDECADMIREAITTALTGEEAQGD